MTAARVLDTRALHALEDFLEFGEVAQRLVAMGKVAWDDDEFHQLAGEAILHRLGEAVTRVEGIDPQLIKEHPEVRWGSVKGIRNVAAHRYNIVDHDILWNTLESDLPQEVAGVRSIVEAHR